MQRGLLAEGRLKGVFDTHLAHRKAVYTARPGGWLAATDHRVVLHMLRGFAADPGLRWETLQRATALSFHGAARTTTPADSRAAEVAFWSRRIGDDGLEDWVQSIGGRCAHGIAVVSMLWYEVDTLEALLARIGLDVAGWAGRGRESGPALGAVLDLFRGRRPEASRAAQVLQELLQPVLGPFFPAEHMVPTWRRVFPDRDLDRLVDELPHTCASMSARYHLAINRGSEREARSPG